jgi:hypothetical protein
MTEPYTDTIIIDCNRNNSVENDAGNNTNPALFTNKQGTGLKLNAGDKVSIHSAFINEIGNTDGTIEFKGNTIKNSKGDEITYELTATTISTSQQKPLDNTWSKNDQAPYTATEPTELQKMQFGKPTGYSEKQILQPYGHKQADASNGSQTFVMKDNEMNMQISYYKTANGENYFHLPRRYDCQTGLGYAAIGTATKIAEPLKAVSNRLGSDDVEEETLVWAYKNYQEIYGLGSPAEVSKSQGYFPFDSGGNGLPMVSIRPESQCEDDIMFQSMGIYTPYESITSGNDPAGIGVPNGLNILGTDMRTRMKNDNSKYKIFVKEQTYFTDAPTYDQLLTDVQLGDQIKPEYWSGKTRDFLQYLTTASEGHTTPDTWDANYGIHYYNIRDPACTGNWVPYSEIKNVKVNEGFSSPEDICEVISQELNVISATEPIYARTGRRNVDDAKNPSTQNTASNEYGGVAHPQVGVKKDGECNKQFYATNHGHFNATNCKEYFCNSTADAIADAPEKSAGCTRYMSAYHYIGIKRPELWETGRAFIEDSMSDTDNWAEWEEYTLHPTYHDTANGGTPISWANRKTSPVVTNIPWSKRHKLKDFFIAQGNFSELFTYKYSNIKTADSELSDYVDENDWQMGRKAVGRTYARYIHFDVISKEADYWRSDFSAGTGPWHHERRRLGSDNYRFQVNTDPTPFGPEADGSFPIDTPASGLVANSNFERQNGLTLRDGYPSPDGGADASRVGPTVVDLHGGHTMMYGAESVPLWFYYDQANSEIDNGDAELGCDISALAYGCMSKWSPNNEDFFITFTTENIGGIPDYFFKLGGNPVADVENDAAHRQELDSNHYIGYDRHFNAYGTKTLMLYSGYLNAVQDCKDADMPADNKTASANNIPSFSYLANVGNMKYPDFVEVVAQGNHGPDAAATTKVQLEGIYRNFLGTQVGANSIALTYDKDNQKRFSFQNLHTPEYIGNNFNGGEDATDPIVDDASSVVYKINKRMTGANFTPEMTPYQTDITTQYTADGSTTGGKIEISCFNHNIIPWDVVYDAHSGIFMENFGGTDANKPFWNKCLWGLLGFSYDQFNYEYETDESIKNAELDLYTRLNFNSRITPDNQGLQPYLYTNANVKSGDITLYQTNSFGANIFGGSIPAGPIFKSGADESTASLATRGREGAGAINAPPISIDTQSITLKASNQPTKMLKPYYLIKSNVVSDMKYIGGGHSTEGGQVLDIMGVVNKENGFGDFYFQTEMKNTFTITQPTTITEITTSIHDPDMSFARVDRNCAVLYMVQKQNSNDLNLVNTLVQTKQFNPQALNPISLTDAEYNQYFKSFVLGKAQMNVEQAQQLQADYQIPDTQANTMPTSTQAVAAAQGGAEQLYSMMQATHQQSQARARPSTFTSFADAQAQFGREHLQSALGGRGGGGQILAEGTMRDRERPQRLHAPAHTTHTPHEAVGAGQATAERSSVITAPSEPRKTQFGDKPKM